MDFSPAHVEYAVSVFYNGAPADQAGAHSWLTNAQRVPEAWNFVWELLQPTKGTEVQFYAATTLHTKILRCWHELPLESYPQLQEKLLQAVSTYSQGPKIVTNRLCISLAAFILQQGTLDLASILRPLSNENNTYLLLEVLTVLPEEFNSMTMGSALRAKNRAALHNASTSVLDDMLRYMQTAYEDFSEHPPSEELVQVWCRAASCACNWMSIDGEDCATSYGHTLPERLPLCRALLTAVHVLYTCNEVVSDFALDACEACLTATRAAASAGDATKHPRAALELMGAVADLAAPIMARDDVPNSSNEDLLSAIITCCVTIGNTHSRCMVEAVERGEAEGARRLLAVLVRAQAAPGHYPVHEARSNLLFGFWYTLQDDIKLLTEDEKNLKSVWREVFSELLSVLVTKSEAPPHSSLCKDDLELLRCYRQDIADSLMYCFSILGECCWQIVEEAFNAAGGGARREAALHVFLALADAAPHERAPPPLLAMLHHALQEANTSEDKRTVNTALDCLGSYAAWLSTVGGARGAELAGACMRAAGAALPRCPAAAALALRKLCAECPAPAADLAPDIVQAALNSRSEDAWTRRQVMAAAGAALAAVESEDSFKLMLSLAETLHADLTAQAQDPTAVSAAGECAVALISSLTSRPDLCSELFRLLAPTLPPFALHPDLVEPMFNILRQVIWTLIGDCLPIADQVSELTISACRTAPCAVGLEVTKLIVLILGNEYPGARTVLHDCIASSAREVVKDASGKSDLTEGLFKTLTAITKKRPAYLDWLEDVLEELVELGCGCVRMWEAGAARAACAWLASLAAQRPGALQARAPALTAAALRCIGGATPRNQIEPLAELLLALNRAEWPAGAGAGAEAGLQGWLRAALEPPGFPTHHATDTHKHKFIAAVIKEKSNKRRLLQTVQEFSLVCRGLVGTEYARQSIAAKQLVA